MNESDRQQELVQETKRSIQQNKQLEESTFFLIAQLRHLNVYDYEYFIHELLGIFSSVDVTLHSKIIDWLGSAYGIVEAQTIVGHVMNNIVGMPLEFEKTSSYGVVVSCRCGAPKEVAEPDSDDDDDAYGSKSTKKLAGAKFVQEVSATSEKKVVIGEGKGGVMDRDKESPPRVEFISGTILAIIRSGDMIKLKSHSRVWWHVFEMREMKGTILLSSKASRVWGATGSKREPKTEYKEVKLAMLLGCMVRRDGVLSPMTMTQYKKQGRDMDFQQTLICSAKDAEKEGYVNATADAYAGEGSRRISIIFQIPGPDLRASLVRMKALVQEYPKVEAAPNSNGRIIPTKSAASQPPLDAVQHMQFQEQAKAWVCRWEEAQRARQVLLKLEPFSCVVSRERWLLAARALKTISRGTTELLQDFINFTKTAGREGQIRMKDCRVAWECLRPTTSADLPALSKARAYLKMRGAGKDAAFFDEQGRLRPEAMNVDSLSRGILEAASTYLSERNVVFLDQGFSNIKVGASVAMHLEEAAQIVSTAVYEHYIIDSPNLEARAVYLGVEVAKAFITAGDVLLIRGIVAAAGADSAQGGNKGNSWVQVISVDLLFARLRIVPCSAPPLCWYAGPESMDHDSLQSSPACWIPLSRIWDVTVCRLVPATDPADFEARRGLHTIFVTPMHSPTEALGVLGAFDRQTVQVTSSSVADSGQLPMRNSILMNKTKNSKGLGAMKLQPGTKKFAVRALSYFTDAVIVGWTPLTINPRPFINILGDMVTPSMNECETTYELEVALTANPYKWMRVYSGKGVGCQISGLEPLHQYYCRVTASIALPNTSEFRRSGRPDDIEKEVELDRRRAQTVITTLGTALDAAPYVSKWETSTSGNARGLVSIYSKDALVSQLPSECFYQVEASEGPRSNVTAAHGDEALAGQNWTAVGRTRNNQCWCVGPFAGKSILLRIRIINQLGQPGAASPISMVQVPAELDRVRESGKAKGKLNESCISDLTQR